MSGKVYLVGAGPGDPKLVTVRATEVLLRADVVLYDRLVSPKILAIAKNAQKVYVGRAVGDATTHQDTTNTQMIQYAKTHKHIVRLKGGDPIIFGRGGEEAEFLKEHNIKYELIPGITSGIGSATYSGIPLTHRKYSSSVVFVTGHEDPEKKVKVVKWKRLAKSVDTIVIMMGLSRIEIICKQLVSGGMPPKTPVAVIENGTSQKHRTIIGNITNIAKKTKADSVQPPVIIIIGKVVDLHEILQWKKERVKK